MGPLPGFGGEVPDLEMGVWSLGWLLIGLLCRLAFGLALEMLLEKVQLQLLRFWPPLKVGCWADMKFGMAACCARALIQVK